MSRANLRWWGLASLAAAAVFGCSIDDRLLTTGSGSLSPEAGTGGSGAGGLMIVPSAVDLGAITQGFAARARLRVSNPGSAPIAAPVVAWASGSDPDFALIQNQCAGALDPGEHCDLRLQVAPSRLGSLQGFLELASANAEKATLPVTASGLSPGPLVIQPAAGSFQDFGGVRVGASAEGTFTISNPSASPSGAVSLGFNRPELTLVPGSAGECVPGVTDLPSGASCNVRVAFAPAERGALEATLSVTSSAAGSRSITLRGRGLIPAALDVSSSLLDFGGVVPGDTASLELDVANEGDEALTLSSAQLSPADTGVFRVANSNCGEGVVLAAEQRCRIQVEYRPVTEGANSAAELLVPARVGGPSQSIALTGVALTRGNLVVEALAAGDEDFGDVLVGQGSPRAFRISNPTQQASGALRLSTRNDFELQSTGQAGGCELGVTELANGESCTVQVSFAPTHRGTKAGALTVDSPLAGAKSLALSGRGVVAGVLAVDTGDGDDLVDFGRVTTGSNASRTLSVRNAGDQPLAPPTLGVSGASASQSAAFEYQNGCTAPLAPNAACQIVLRFAPEAVVPYAASLDLVDAAGERSSVLLLGEALEPGRLVLAPAENASPDFGDVAVGSSVSHTFTVTNPGGGASGALSVRTDDSQFLLGAGACAGVGTDGLADGESCAFEVSFTPTTNVAIETRLSVQAAGSGESGIALSGRGRLPSALAATTTERDLGRANLGQPSGPTNQFTWTVNNGGDLPSGVLSVSNSAPEDFDITADTCRDVAVPGGGSCALTIAFAPDAAGDRSTRITVGDVASGQSVPLVVTGSGVQLAAPGEACLATSDCSAGVCTGGVCCDQECSLTCQSCATGQCLALSGQEACGNSGGVCFGVEQCSLPAGGGCTTSSECGGGLVCKQCLAGGSQCTAPDACCGGCGPGHQCIDGECGCPLQADGTPRLDCGGGICALNRANACCPNDPAAACNCDPSDNLCKECLDNADCTEGLVGGVATCNTNRTCNYGCPGQTKECNGSCIANTACCGGCPAGQSCNGSGQCVVQNGGACGFGLPQCASGNCAAGLCCNTGCNNGCFSDGTCGCPQGQQFARGQCRGGSGATCVNNNDCATSCVTFYEDRDNDEFGDINRPVRFCGSPPATINVVADIGRPDCCDADVRVNPGSTLLFPDVSVDPSVCPAFWKDNDLNCDGALTYRDHQISNWSGRCDQDDLPENDPNIPCAQRSGVSTFQAELFGFGPLFDANDDATLCGNSSVQHIHCEVIGGVCTGNPQLRPPCH